MKSLIVSILSLAGAVSAQQSAYGQCGGSSYSGSTVCVTDYFCTSYNPWYYQCVPGTATATTTSTSATSTSTTTTSVKSTTSTSSTSSKSSTTSTTLSTSSTSKTTTSSSTSTTSTTKSSTSTTKSSTTTSSSVISTATGFVKTSGLFFDIDGKAEYYAGTNCYWCGFLTEDGDVTHVFSDIASSGLKFVRVWGFNDVNTIPANGTVWYQYLAETGSEINTGEYGLQRLDAVVAAAEAYDVKLIINFVNNWSDYGGIAAYVAAFGGNSSSWFTDSASQDQYRTYIQAVVSRYSSSPAILSWELCNEPRYGGDDYTVIYNWASSTSAYIKSLDSNHMVTIGDEGFGPTTGGDGSYPFQIGAGGYNWQQNLEITTLDFATFHLYPQSWGTAATWGNLWITTHAAACVNASKPCLLEEYGYSDECSVESIWQALSLNTTGMAADSFWQYGDVLPSCSCQTSQDGNTVYFNDTTTDWACFVTEHIAAIDAIYG